MIPNLADLKKRSVDHVQLIVAIGTGIDYFAEGMAYAIIRDGDVGFFFVEKQRGTCYWTSMANVRSVKHADAPVEAKAK
jgi:hypothetical protein